MIQIENQPLLLKPLPKDFPKLPEEVNEYLLCFQKGHTISQVVRKFLKQGRLVQFSKLFKLVDVLYQKNLIQNPVFKSYFDKIEAHQKPSPKAHFLSGLFKKENPSQYLERHPFFRSQPPILSRVFARHAEILEVKPGTVLCQRGQLERDLFFMIDGEAAIYHPTEKGGRKLLGFFGRDAVIGEIGFFIGEVRSADVVITKPSKVVAIRYASDVFDKILSKNMAKELTMRFRVMHALSRSPFLKNIPEEAINALIFAGKLRQVPEFDVICKEGESGESCYFVINGSVSVSKGAKSVSVLGPGDAFGELALFFTEGTRTATVMAQRETSILEIYSTDFYNLLAENLLLAKEFEKLAYQRIEKLKKVA